MREDSDSTAAWLLSTIRAATEELTLQMATRLENLANAHRIQGRSGNWDQSEYMRGYYNGLERAMSILDDRGAKYKEPHGYTRCVSEDK